MELRVGYYISFNDGLGDKIGRISRLPAPGDVFVAEVETEGELSRYLVIEELKEVLGRIHPKDRSTVTAGPSWMKSQVGP